MFFFFLLVLQLLIDQRFEWFFLRLSYNSFLLFYFYLNIIIIVFLLQLLEGLLVQNSEFTA